MRKTACILLAAILLLLAGCGQNETPAATNAPAAQENQLADWEKDLLLGMSAVKSERKNIESGNLASYQQTELEQARSVMKYLNEKYPGQQFRIYATEGRNPVSGRNYITYKFTLEGGFETFNVIAYTFEDGDFRDDFYIHEIGSRYADAFSEKLNDAGIEVIAAKTDFSSLMGDEVNGQEDPEILFSIGGDMTRVTKIYISGTDAESALNDAAHTIEELGIYGSYIVLFSAEFTDGMTANECDNIFRTAPEDVQYVTTNIFWNDG